VTLLLLAANTLTMVLVTLVMRRHASVFRDRGLS